MVAAAAFAVNGLSYGLLRTLGLALPDLAEHFERSAQDTAWVSALALAVQQAASEGGPRRGAGAGGPWKQGSAGPGFRGAELWRRGAPARERPGEELPTSAGDGSGVPGRVSVDSAPFQAQWAAP